MTIRCETCGFENVTGATRCELCGEDLPQSFASRAYDHPHRVPTGLKPLPVAEPQDKPTATGMAVEPAPESPDGQRQGPTHPSRATLGEGQPPTGPTTYTGAQKPQQPETLLGRVKLVVEQGMIIGEQYLLSEPRMVIGRSDPSSAIYPDIDLTGQDNEYVHRRHALLQFYDLDARLSVEHVGGHNPTLVNNEPLVAGELVEIKVGDRLRVGRVVMRLLKV